VIHKPLDKQYPNADGMLEFKSRGKMTLLFLQMTFESPQDHTNSSGIKKFFTKEGNEYRALNVNMEKFNPCE